MSLILLTSWRRLLAELVVIVSLVEMLVMGVMTLLGVHDLVAIFLGPILLASISCPMMLRRVRLHRVRIERRKQVVHKLEALRKIFDDHTLFSITDKRGRIIDVNKGFCRISGYSREELIGKDHRILNSGYHHKTFWREMWATVSSGRVWRAEVCNRAKDGSIYWVDSTNIPQYDKHGELTGYISLRLDITRKKLLEERLDMAMRAANIGVWDWDITTDETYFSDTWYTMLGYAPGELPMSMDSWKRLCDPEQLAELIDDLERSKSGQTHSFVTKHRMRKKDGDWLWVRDIGEIVERDPKGNPTRMVGVHLDIDHLKRFNRALEQVIEVEVKPTLKETCEDICLHIAELYGVTFAAVVRLPDGEDSEHADIIGGIHNGQRIGDVRYALRGTPCEIAAKQPYTEFRDGLTQRFPEDKMLVEIRARSYASVRLQNSRGEVIGLLVMLHNKPLPVSYQIEPTMRIFGTRATGEIERQRVEEGLQLALRETELANRAKSEFLANMSHEIRTPMTAILGYTDLILESSSNSPVLHEQVETIQKNAKHLMTVINDILDLSKIESGRLDIERIPTHPLGTINEVIALMEHNAHAKGLRCVLERDEGVPAWINTDPTRFRQILLNLVSNAVKFTEQGSVELRLSYDEPGDRLIVRVTDTGIGMTPEQRDRIAAFQPFSQADSSTARKYGGAGLGLRISSMLADRLGGGLQIESSPGVGTSVTLTIEADAREAQQRHRQRQEACKDSPGEDTMLLQGRRILVAEDGPDNQRLIRAVLSRAGASVQIAENGRLAIEAVRDHPDAFDLILMDVQMPEVDGYEATTRLRASGCTLPIIALTAHAMQSDREQCLRVGCNEYLVKPINRERLIRTCHRYIVEHKAEPKAA